MADPLEDAAYMLSVVETIADSLLHHSSTTVHDLLDAYVTFTNRVRAHSSRLEAYDGAPFPALAPLKTHKDNFIHALRRDIRLAHHDPFSYSHLSSDQPALALGNSIQPGVKADSKQHARASSSLCHHALCVLTAIFRFPALYSLFPELDLSILFGDVLDIALAGQLPVLNRAKTYSFSLWALSSHRLPVAVVSSRQDDVFSALQRCFGGTRQPDSVALDGLKAISHTIEHYQSRFLDLLFPLLPHVIAAIRCEPSGLRLQASIALGKFAIALIHQTELTLSKWRSLSNHIAPFLESCCHESDMAHGNPSFSYIIRAALSAESHVHPRGPPTWIFTILASWIVLCGPTLYSKPTILRFILQVLAMTLTHKRSVIRALHPHVWRCFVWTFSRILLSSENVHSSLVSSAFYVIKQEVSGGVGIALVNVLLSDRVSAVPPEEQDNRVSQALSVIKAMVRTECKHTRKEGFVLLQALTKGTPVDHPVLQNAHETPTSVLLDGVIIGVEWDSIPSIIRSIPKVPISVHRLDQAKVAQHYKTLLAIWKHFAINADKNESRSDLVCVWLSILKACSHQLECGTATATLMYTATIIVEFLPSAVIADLQLDWGSWNIHDQLCILTLIDQLWSAMQQTFVAFSLADAAALILTSILKYAFHVLDPDVRTMWSKLCAHLMMTTSRSFLLDMQDLTTPQSFIRTQRELWGVVAASLSSSGHSFHWKEMIKFLSIPACTWALSEPELAAWDTLLQNTITLSGDSVQVTEYLVLWYFQGTEIETWGSIIVVLNILLSCIHERGNSPANGLLSVTNVCLIASYSGACHSPEALTHSLELLDGICRVITSAPGRVMGVLQVISRGLCLWIEDHAEVMSDDQFNSVAVSLYCETLKALEDLPLSIQFLQDTEAFLTSAFCRIPIPAIAPFAFEKFWRATYHGHSQFCNIIPPKIKSCLACFVAAYGGDLCDGLSLATESQSQSINNGSQALFSVNHQGQESDEVCGNVNPSLTSANNGTWPEVFDVDVSPHGRQQTFTSQEATAFLLPSPDNNALQPTVLRQLQESSSRMDPTSLNHLERSMSGPQTPSSSVFPPCGAISSPRTVERIPLVTSHLPNKKRKLGHSGDVLQKRSRISRNTLRSLRKLGSEPATRDVTPIEIPRTSSVPPRRMVFDGVQVPTRREVWCRKLAQREETNKNNFDTNQDHMSPPRTYLSRSTRRNSRTPAPDDDSLDWENYRVSTTSSGVDIEQSLMVACPSSPAPSRTPVHEPPNGSYLPSRPSSTRAMSQSESPPARLSLRRAKTTSARLDALRDVYSSVENGASQIPMSELLQATRLVHQIGAVLTEQMGKKMDGPAR